MNRLLTTVGVLAFACGGPAPVDKPPVTPPPAGTISGHAYVNGADGTREPAGNVELVLRPGDVAQRTAADGSFAFTGLAASTFSLEGNVDLDGDRLADGGAYIEKIVLPAGEGVDVGDVLLGSLGEVRVGVTYDGKPVVGVLVSIGETDRVGAGEDVSVTDEQGRILFRRVVPGRYVARALVEGTPALAGSGTITVVPATPTSLELVLAPVAAVATLRGKVRTPDGAGAATLTIQGPVNAHQDVASGTEFLVQLTPGRHAIVITTGADATTPFFIPDLLVFGETVLADVVLAPSAPASTRDLDGDGVTAASDPDDDGDGVPDADEPAATRLDRFSTADTDGDGIGDGLDRDDDGDGESDLLDRCPDRFDPPGMQRPPDCLPYPPTRVLVDTAEHAVVDEAFTVSARSLGGRPGTTYELKTPDALPDTVTIERTGPASWNVIATRSGGLVLEVAATDALGTISGRSVLDVVAPDLTVQASAEAGGDVEVPITLAAGTRDELVGTTFAWSIASGPGELTFEPPDAAETMVTGVVAGSWVVRVTATRGARIGHADVAFTLVAPPIRLELPASIEVTAGESTTFTITAVSPSQDVVLSAREQHQVPGLVSGIAVAGTAVSFKAETSGETTLVVEASRRARRGEASVTVVVHPVGAVKPVVAGPVAVVGKARMVAVTTDPPLPGAIFTFTLDPSNPSGDVLTSAGATFTMTAAAAGSHVVVAEARSGAKIARGRIAVESRASALVPTFAYLPYPIVAINAPTTVTASVAGQPAGSVQWAWSPQSSNPEVVTLSGASTATIGFTPTKAGTYRFDAIAATATQAGAGTFVIDVVDPNGIPLDAWIYPAHVGQRLEMYGAYNRNENFSDAAQIHWTADPQNPSPPLFTTPDDWDTYALPTVAGTYRFTLSVVDGARHGQRTFVTQVLAENDPGYEFGLTIGQVEATAGDDVWVDANFGGSFDSYAAQWSAAPGNPAALDLSNATGDRVSVTPPLPGVYVIFATVTLANGTEVTRETALRVQPEVPIQVTTTGGFLDGPLFLTASSTDTSGPIKWRWYVSSYPTGYPRGGPQLKSYNTATTSIPLSVAGTHTFNVQATLGRRVTQKIVAFDPLPTRGPVGKVSPQSGTGDPPPWRAAVGVPFTMGAFCRNCFDTTYLWTQNAADPVRVTILDADKQIARFVPRETGLYRFSVNIGDWSYPYGGSDNVYVQVEQTLPDVVFDGPPTLSPAVEGSAWACHSGRTDIVSATFEPIDGGLDADLEVAGDWLHLMRKSSAKQIAGYRCTVKTQGGQVFSATRPIIASDVYSPRVFFVKPTGGAAPVCTAKPLPAGCLGTYDDPYTSIPSWWPYYGGHDALVLLPGTYDVARQFAYGAFMIGGVDPVTWKQDPVATPSVLRWASAGFTNALIYPMTLVSGLTLKITGATGSTVPLIAIQSAYNEKVLRNTIEITAGVQQPVSAIRSRDVYNDEGNPPTRVVANNRIRITGGKGAAAVEDNCRAFTFAHNVIAVDATSQLSRGVWIDCTGAERHWPVMLVNNAIWMGNAGTGYDFGSAPAAEPGHRFGGNWFKGTGPFVTATGLSPAFTATTPAQLNAGRAAGGLDGANNSNDSGCFGATPPASMADWKVLPGSSCVGTAVSPGSYPPDPSALGSDLRGVARNLATGYAASGATGANDPGAEEL